MNPEIQEQRVVEIIRETCRKLDVKFRYEVAGDCEDGIYLLPVYDCDWRKRRAQWAITGVMAANAGCLISAIALHFLSAPNLVGVAALSVVAFAALCVCALVNRMPTIPSVILHLCIDGELIAAGFQVRRHGENAAEISYRG